MKEKALVEQMTKSLRKVASTITYDKSADDKFYSREFGSRSSKAMANPFKGRVTIQATQSGYVLGTNYENSVAGAAVRSGATDSVKEVEVKTKQVWHKHYNDFFNVDRATESKYYLKVQASNSQKENFCKDTFVWILDGKKEINPNTYAEVIDGVNVPMANFLKPVKEKQMSSTQAEAGVNAENEQHFFLVALDNLTSVTQKEFSWKRK
jgi:hypothetical protein